MDKKEYWKDVFSELIDSLDLTASDDFLDRAAGDLALAHEMYSESTGELSIPNPLRLENQRLKEQLEKERNKQVCPDCSGTGEDVSHGPFHTAISTCSKCNGEGKV